MNFDPDSNSIGEAASRWIEESIPQPERREQLRPALSAIADAVEMLCPVVLQAGGGSLKTYYGPSPELSREDWVVLFVTETGHARTCVYGFPPDEEIETKTAELYQAVRESPEDDFQHFKLSIITGMFKLLEQDDASHTRQIAELWVLWVGVKGKQAVIKQTQEIKRRGNVPVVVNIVTGVCGGAMYVIGLPPAIRIQPSEG